jgi:hypothetical protein
MLLTYGYPFCYDYENIKREEKRVAVSQSYDPKNYTKPVTTGSLATKKPQCVSDTIRALQKLI